MGTCPYKVPRLPDSELKYKTVHALAGYNNMLVSLTLTMQPDPDVGKLRVMGLLKI
jgi:hypothetical protein